MSIYQLDTENADVDLAAGAAVLTDTPNASEHVWCQAYVKLGDGAKNLDGNGGNFTFVITVGGQTVQPSPTTLAFGTEVRSSFWTDVFPVPANEAVVITVTSPNAGDSDVDVTSYLFEVAPLIYGSDNMVKISTDAQDLSGSLDVNAKTLGDDCITSAKFDESTAYPVKSADTGATALARTGADSDTLETLSDQMDTIDTVVDAILVDTGTTLPATLATIAGYIDTEVAAILADTNELQGDWTDGGRLDLLLDAIKAKTDNLPSSVPKNVAFSNFAFTLYSNQDHVTPVTGLSVSGFISHDGGAFAGLTNAVSAIDAGIYKVDLEQTEMNADVVVLRFTATGADDRVVIIKTDA
jgi:hypothetical protein